MYSITLICYLLIIFIQKIGKDRFLLIVNYSLIKESNILLLRTRIVTLHILFWSSRSKAADHVSNWRKQKKKKKKKK